jgi:hypothetical protein
MNNIKIMGSQAGTYLVVYVRCVEQSRRWGGFVAVRSGCMAVGSGCMPVGSGCMAVASGFMV